MLAPSCRFSESCWEKYTGPQRSHFLLLCSQAHELNVLFHQLIWHGEQSREESILRNQGIYCVGGREGFTNRKYGYCHHLCMSVLLQCV